MDGITDSMNMNLGKPRERVKNKVAWHAAVHGVAELDRTYQLNNSILKMFNINNNREIQNKNYDISPHTHRIATIKYNNNKKETKIENSKCW